MDGQWPTVDIDDWCGKFAPVMPATASGDSREQQTKYYKHTEAKPE